MKLILVNSIGPMGCACTCSIIEKFGFINLPVRKRGLTDYVLGKRDIKNDDFFKIRTIEILKEGSIKKRIGGNSVFERELNEPKYLYDLSKIKHELIEFENKKYNSIKDAYFDSMILFNKATIYKNKIVNIKGSIEQILDIHKTFNTNIYNKYKEEFGDILFVNLERDFDGWISAICGQNFMREKLKVSDYKFSVLNYYKLYINHKKFFKNLNGLDYNFSNIFLPHTKQYIDRICNDFNEKNDLFYDLSNIKFDSYGHMYGFEDQFTYRDKNLTFLSSKSLKIVEIIKKYYTSNLLLSKFYNIIFQFFYNVDMIIFRKKNKKVINHEITKKEFYGNN